MRLFFWILALAAIEAAAGARDGTVLLRDGTTLMGDVTFGTNGWTVHAADSTTVEVPLDNLAHLTFAAPPVDDGSGTNHVAAVEAVPGVAEKWGTNSIGNALSGSCELAGEAWKVVGGGGGLRGNADSCFLAQRRLDVSGQIMARLESFDGTAPEAMAGLTLRDNAGEAAAYAFVGQRSGSGLCFQYRQIAGGMTMRVTNVVLELPVWLRLSRVGGAVVSEISSDGREWRPLGRANVNLGGSVMAGMVLSSGSDEQTAMARFQHPTLGARGVGYIPPNGYPRLTMRGGSILVAPILSADESILRLGGEFTGGIVSVLNVARIDFTPLTPELESLLDPQRVGALLTDGDFFDGPLRGFQTNTVTMGSLLFGYRGFAPGTEAAVVQVGAVEPDDAPFQVELHNGSRLIARRLSIEPDSVRAESPLLGSLALRPADIQKIVRADEMN